MTKKVGEITHFFSNISVAVIQISDTLEVGDKIRIKGSTTDFEQEVDSMQIEHENIEKAEKGQDIGMKVKDNVRPGDEVFVVD